MAKKTRVGLIFSYNEDWIGGTYYVLNIIHSLNTLPAVEKPIIVVISDSIENFTIVREETQYPFLEYFQYPFKKISYTFLERFINKISFTFLNKKWISKTIRQPIIDILYPYYIDKIKVAGLKKINWIPDFQELHLPQYFSEEALAYRKHLTQKIIAKGDYVVFSSKDAKKDYNTLVEFSSAQEVVIPFAVSHPDFSNMDIEILLKKYALPNKYFFAPNQFWTHKNHEVILKATKILSDKNIHVKIAFSGKENDYRNEKHFSSLKQKIKAYGIEKKIVLLGFLDRKEQLSLLQKASLIIQPSFFEGWSTVVEDAKALDKYIILSDISVHKEQIQKGVSFFDPNDASSLAELLEYYWYNKIPNVQHNYNDDVKKFGRKFMQFVKEAKR